MCHTVSEIIVRRVLLVSFTDRYSLFQAIAKSNPVREKNRLILASILKDAYSYSSLDNLGFIRTRFNPSDPLSKDIVDKTLLLGLLREEKLEHEVVPRARFSHASSRVYHL